MVYFVRESTGGLIKIGSTIRLAARLSALRQQYKTELTVLGIMDGGRAEEAALHRRFDLLRVTGEWFRPGPLLLDLIACETRQWSEADDAPVKAGRLVKIDPETVKSAILIAGMRRVKWTEYLNDTLAEIVRRDYEEAYREYMQTREKTVG